MNINKAILMGRITADPELKNTANNTSVVQFSVAVNRKYDREKTDFIDCTAFGKNADFISTYFRKGSSIIVFGNIQVESFKDKDGNNRRNVRVIVDEAQFGESKANKTNVNVVVETEVETPTFEELSLGEDAELPF